MSLLLLLELLENQVNNSFASTPAHLVSASASDMHRNTLSLKLDEIPLPDPHKTRFECNGEDLFDIDIEGDVGEITELCLGHDNTGQGPDWRVKWAEVVDKHKGGHNYVFIYDCDIGGKKKKGEPESVVKKVQKAGTERPGKKKEKE